MGRTGYAFQSINAQPVFSRQFYQLLSGFNCLCSCMNNGIGKKIEPGLRESLSATSAKEENLLKAV